MIIVKLNEKEKGEKKVTRLSKSEATKVIFVFFLTRTLKGEAILLSKSERASPTYLSPTSKPSNLPRC